MKKLNEKSQNISGPNKHETHTMTLEQLTTNLEKQFAEEVQSCWVDPQKIVLDKFLGHGKIWFVFWNRPELCPEEWDGMSNQKKYWDCKFQETLQWCGQVP